MLIIIEIISEYRKKQLKPFITVPDYLLTVFTVNDRNVYPYRQCFSAQDRMLKS